MLGGNNKTYEGKMECKIVVEWKGNKEDTLAIVVCVLLEAPKSG
jgi:hypothetical protein